MSLWDFCDLFSLLAIIGRVFRPVHENKIETEDKRKIYFPQKNVYTCKIKKVVWNGINPTLRYKG
jgi:hypothetical protein